MKYTILSKTKNVIIGAFLSIVTMAFPAYVHGQISAKLEIILNDEACVQLINQIKQLQESLEQTLTQELAGNKKIECVIQNHIIKICSFAELRKINDAKGAVIKVLLALCDASSAFIEEILEKNQTHTPTLQSFKEKALSACDMIRQMISGSCNVSSPSRATTNTAALEKCYTVIAGDLNQLINLHASVVINNIPVSLAEIDSRIHPYTIQFSKLFNKALTQHLSDKDITVLKALIESTAYTKLKKNIPQITQLISQSFSPEVKTQTEGLLVDSWNQTRGTIINFLQKLKNGAA